MVALIPYFSWLLGESWLFVLTPLYLLLAFLYFGGNIQVKFFKWFFAFLLTTLLGRSGLLTLFTYIQWKEPGTLSSYLLPPHQPISYFFSYSFTHFFASLLLTALATIAVATLFLVTARRWERAGRKLWGQGEEYIFLSGAFLVRWPLVIPYLFFGVLAAIGYFVYLRYAAKARGRLLNIVPFFVILVPLLLWLAGPVIAYLGLSPLLMP